MLTRHRVIAVAVLGVVLGAGALFGQGELTLQAILNAIYDPSRQALMGVRWAEAQNTIEQTAQEIFNRIYVPATETSNAHIRVKAFETGTDLPASCVGGESAFVDSETGQFCLCNELGDGWLCYDTPASALEAGSVGPTELEDTAVTPGSYGDASTIPNFTVDADGRLTTAGEDAIVLGTGSVGATEIASTAVTPGSYGDASTIPNFTVDADGRLTAAGEDAIVLGAGSVGPTELASTAVTPAAYGSGLLIPAITFDADGRATAASTNPIDASYMKTLCSLGYDGGTNTSSSGSGAFMEHTLECVVPAAKLTTGSVLHICTGWQVSTGATAPALTLQWLANDVVVNQPDGATTPTNNLVRNVNTCLTMTVAGVPDTSVNTYSMIMGNQADVASNGGGATSQPVAINTSGTVSLTQGSRWGTAGTGTNTFTQRYMVVFGSGLVP